MRMRLYLACTTQTHTPGVHTDHTAGGGASYTHQRRALIPPQVCRSVCAFLADAVGVFDEHDIDGSALRARTHARMHTCIQARTCTRACKHARARTHTRSRSARTRVHTRTHGSNIHAHTRAHTRAYTRTHAHTRAHADLVRLVCCTLSVARRMLSVSPPKAKGIFRRWHVAADTHARVRMRSAGCVAAALAALNCTTLGKLHVEGGVEWNGKLLLVRRPPTP